MAATRPFRLSVPAGLYVLTAAIANVGLSGHAALCLVVKNTPVNRSHDSVRAVIDRRSCIAVLLRQSSPRKRAIDLNRTVRFISGRSRRSSTCLEVGTVFPPELAFNRRQELHRPSSNGRRTVSCPGVRALCLHSRYWVSFVTTRSECQPYAHE